MEKENCLAIHIQFLDIILKIAFDAHIFFSLMEKENCLAIHIQFLDIILKIAFDAKSNHGFS